jgi:hypothetical protein
MPRNHRKKGANIVAEKSIYVDGQTHKRLKEKAKSLSGKKMTDLAIELINAGLDGKAKNSRLRQKKEGRVLGVKELKLMRQIADLLNCSSDNPLLVLEAVQTWIIWMREDS